MDESLEHGTAVGTVTKQTAGARGVTELFFRVNKQFAYKFYFTFTVTHGRRKIIHLNKFYSGFKIILMK